MDSLGWVSLILIIWWGCFFLNLKYLLSVEQMLGCCSPCLFSFHFDLELLIVSSFPCRILFLVVIARINLYVECCVLAKILSKIPKAKYFSGLMLICA